MTNDERLARIRILERRIAELRVRLPKHSPKVDILIELDELDDELRQLTNGPAQDGNDTDDHE